MAPFFLWPLEVLLPYPHILEELAKALLVLSFLNVNRLSSKIKLAIAVGVAFALSESVLYLFNVFATGSLRVLWARLALTIPLHAGTTVIILLSAQRDKRFILLGFIMAVVIHYLFNQVVS